MKVGPNAWCACKKISCEDKGGDCHVMLEAETGVTAENQVLTATTIV